MAWDFGYGFDQEDPRLKLIRQMDPGMFPGILSAGQPAQTPGTGLLTALPEDAADRGSYASLPPSRPIDIAPRAPTPPPIQRSDAGNVVGPPQAMASGPVTQPATSSADPLSSIMGGLGRNSDALLSFGAGLMSGRNWGEGLSKGVAGMQEADKNSAATALARMKLGQQVQSQNATLAYLMSKGLSKTDAIAAASNPHVLTPLLTKLNQDPTLVTAKNPDGTERQVWAKPGQTLDQAIPLGDAYDTDRNKPQLVDVTLPDGTTQKQWVSPNQSAGTAVGAPKQEKDTWTQVDVPQPNGSTVKQWVQKGASTGVTIGSPGAAEIPGVDPAKLAEERAKVQAKKEGDAFEKGEVARSVMPHVDRAVAAYSKLKEMNAIGPINALGPSRFIASVAGTEAEKLRQEYEAAQKELELYKAQTSMKGQGAITESERKLLATTLPRLDAADAATGMNSLRILHQGLMRDMGKGANGAIVAPGGAVPGAPATGASLQPGGSTVIDGITIKRVR